MNRSRKFGVSTLLLAGVAFFSPTPAEAICGVPISFGQVDYNCAGYFCYVVSPGLNTTESIEATFWAYGGFGDPAIGSGDDNGGWEDDAWLKRYNASYPLYMTGTWAQDDDIDGCIANKKGSGKDDEVMVAMFADTNSSESVGYFAVAAARRVPAESPQFDFTFVAGGGTAQDIDLVEIPAPEIVEANRVSSTQTDVTVRCPSNLADGFYSDGSVTAEELVSGCNFYRAIVSRGADAPDHRDRGDSMWEKGAGPVAPGSTGVVTVDCASDCDAYVAVAVATESAFESGYLSGNSPRIEAGPNLADPREPRFRVIDRKRPARRER